jgi:hypothetical protein
MIMLRYGLILFFVGMLGFTTRAQFGFGLDYFPERFTLESDGPESFLLRNGSLIYINGHFRLRNVRVEFLPYLGYFSSKGDYTLSGNELNVKGGGLALGSRIHFYPMDFYNDCKCPTFNKSGLWFKKGLYLYVDPQFLNYTFDRLSDLYGIEDETFSNLNTSFGIGLDMGFSSGLIISPYFAYNASILSFTDNHFVSKFSGGSQIIETLTSRKSSPLIVGIGLQYRLNYK